MLSTANQRHRATLLINNLAGTDSYPSVGPKTVNSVLRGLTADHLRCATRVVVAHERD